MVTATKPEIRIELPYKPTPRQCIAHSAVETNVLYGGAVGGGKSVWLCNEGLQLSLDYRGNIGYLCRHELASFRKTTLLTLQEFLPGRLIRSHSKTEGMIYLVNGSVIMYGGLGDDQNAIERLKSMNLGWFGIDQAEETTESHFFMLASRLRLKVPGIHYKSLLTANPEPGWVRDRFIDNHYPDHVFIPALPSDNPHLPADYESKLRQLYSNNPELIKALLEGNWDVTLAGDYLIAYSLVRAAIARELPAAGNCEMGVDVARFGDDETVVMVRRGMKITSVDSWGKQDTVFTAGKVAEIARRENVTAVNVDEIGIGAGVVDILRANKINVVGVVSSEAATKPDIYSNKRAELYSNLAQHFLEGSISIPDVPKLSSQLSSLKYKFDTHHRKIIESKDDIKKRSGKSPDYADCLMLAFSNFRPETVVKGNGYPSATSQRGLAGMPSRVLAYPMSRR
jgi:phage terminase large subunit